MLTYKLICVIIMLCLGVNQGKHARGKVPKKSKISTNQCIYMYIHIKILKKLILTNIQYSVFPSFIPQHIKNTHNINILCIKNSIFIMLTFNTKNQFYLKYMLTSKQNSVIMYISSELVYQQKTFLSNMKKVENVKNIC